MPNWSTFFPRGYEYDYDRDKLHLHRVTIDEAVQCFQNGFAIRRNKSYKNRFKLIGISDEGRRLCIIFQLKRNNVVRIITGWEV
jgi:uncharacterized DUF497 family protein